MTDILKIIKKSDKGLFVGMAGPGTGKSYSFKKIIESEEYKEKSILILSFINKLVDDLTEDFKGFSNVRVLTLHAFARQELNKVAGGIDLDQDLDDFIEEDHILMKGNEVKYKEKFYDNNLVGNEENFYKERRDFYKYDKELYSFNSIIYAVNKLFSKYEAKIPRHDLILIDEFQDFNKSEYELIKLLNKKNKIILVGDDNQSLYNFKSAKPEQIINLYNDPNAEGFSLDFCYRCTRVLVDATNSLIENAKKRGYLKNRSDKKFLYPEQDEKNKISLKHPKIDFIPSVSGELLIYSLAQNIKNHIVSKNDKKRILILVPSYLKQTIYDGLIGKGFNIVEFELFSNEESNKRKHKSLIKAFETLTERKTDNLALRKVLFLYLDDSDIEELLKKVKKIWSCLSEETKEKIERDIDIFKKTKRGKEKLDNEELKRFSEVFALKNVLSRLIKGFKPVMKDAIEVEMTTVTSSKGLSADIVYYVGIDDQNMLDEETGNFSDHKICEFLVGITRAKEKLTLISLKDKNPKILEFIDKKFINNLNNEK